MTTTRLHRIIVLLLALLVTMPLMAQELVTQDSVAQGLQRKVTPVKPSTNKVLTPPKGTDEKIIQQYLTGDTAQARAQERKDSLAKIYPHYPTLTELSLGLNFGDALLMIFGQKYSSFDISATLNMLNRFQPVLTVGLGRAKETPDDMNFTYKGNLSPYFKLGANYNLLFKKEPQYQLYVGVRLGFSSFKYDITDVTINNPYWGENNVNYELKGVSGNALWGEFLAGLKVGLTTNWALGWDVRFHGLFKEKKNDSGNPWYIPGYGTRNGKWAFGISLYYTIPLNHDRWPVKDDKKKEKKDDKNSDKNPPSQHDKRPQLQRDK